jgi:hypothetical protein
LQAVEGGNRSTSRENHTLVSQLCRGDKKFHLGEQGGEAGVGVGGRGEREGEKGGGVPRGEAAAERDGEADGAGDPADLLGQRAGFDHRRDLLQIWKRAAASATPNPGNSGGKVGFRRAGEEGAYAAGWRLRAPRRRRRAEERPAAARCPSSARRQSSYQRRRRRGDEDEEVRRGTGTAVRSPVRLCFRLKKVENALLSSARLCCWAFGPHADWNCSDRPNASVLPVFFVI